MAEKYVLPPEAGKKLKAARETGQPVYVYAITGSGKTALVRNSSVIGRCTYVSCLNESCRSEVERRLGTDEKRQKVIVVDDLQYLTDDSFKDLIRRITTMEDVWLILLSRGRIPEWLKPADFRRKFMTIYESDMLLGFAQVQKLFMNYGLIPERGDLEKITEFCEGNGYVANSVAQHMKEGCSLKRSMEIEADIVEDHLENDIIPMMQKEVRDFLVALSVVDSFTEEMASLIYGTQDAMKMIRAVEECSNFLMKEGSEYRMMDHALVALRAYVRKNVPESVMWKYYERAGKWCESHGMDYAAMKLFEKTGSRKRINSLLLKNALKDPGAGYLYEMREFYFSIPEDEVKERPLLMSALSIVNSLMMDIKTSEKWYGRLKSFGKTAEGKEKEEVGLWLNALDIILPHKTADTLLPALKKLPEISKDLPSQAEIPEFSSTGIQPSLINGMKDLSEWTLDHDAFAKKNEGLFASLPQKLGDGLLSLFLAEAGYEKAGKLSEILKHLSEARFEIENSGKTGSLFAVCAINAKLLIADGDPESAENILRSFSSKAEGSGRFAAKLRPQIEALKVRLSLYRGELEIADEWLRYAPDEEEFFLGERYCYLTKIRVYIAKGKYVAALSLIEKMSYYARNYGRTMIKAELLILSSIIKYRTEDDWEEDILEALEILSKYRFVRTLSGEGPAVIDLIEAARQDIEKDKKIDRDYFNMLFSDVRKMANLYPMYMKAAVAAMPTLPERAISILRLQAEGSTMKAIAEKLSMKESTVKYYIKNTYFKLSASSKTEAVMKAKALGLL